MVTSCVPAGMAMANGTATRTLSVHAYTICQTRLNMATVFVAFIYHPTLPNVARRPGRFQNAAHKTDQAYKPNTRPKSRLYADKSLLTILALPSLVNCVPNTLKRTSMPISSSTYKLATACAP